MKSLRLYQCGTCKLKRELLLEKDSPDLYNCVMTAGCLGKIKLLSQRAGTRPKRYDVSIFTDFDARGFQAPAAKKILIDPLVSLESGVGVLTAAFIKQGEAAPGVVGYYIHTNSDLGYTLVQAQQAILLELIELEPLAKSERKYVFAPNGQVSSLAGEDDSTLRRTLRIAPDQENVTILVDGVKLSDAYFSITTTSLDTIATVTFNPVLTGASKIEIAVFSEPVQTQDNTLTLRFEPLLRGDAARKIIAWGGSTGATILTDSYVTSTCSDLSQFNPSKNYLVKRAYVESQPDIELVLSKAQLLLAYKPYAFEDKQLDSYVSLSSLTTERCSLQRDDDGIFVLKTSQAALTKATKLIQDHLSFNLFGDDNNSSVVSIVNKPTARAVIGPI